MTYKIHYLVGKTKTNNTEHWGEIEAENAHFALKAFRAEHPEAKITVCIQKQ